MSVTLNSGPLVDREGFLARLEVRGRIFNAVLKGLRTFRGIINEAPEFDPRAELGSDLREVALLEVLRGECPKEVDYETGIIDTSTNQKFSILKRIDNPADIRIRFWMVKVVAGIDT